MTDGIRIGQSSAQDPVRAVRELQELLDQPWTELVIFFCSSDYDLDAIAEEMNRSFAGVQVVGCTTAGEIGPLGYLDRSLCGLSFPSGSFTAVSGRVDGLQGFDPDDGEALVGLLLGRLEMRNPKAREKSMFAFQMIDGLSAREELVTRAFQLPLGIIPLMGGSAGDAGRFAHTLVFERGSFHEDSAVLVIAASSVPFTTFCTQSLTGTDRRGVVTAVGPSGRTVLEIDALPATEGYARLFGADPTEQALSFFAAHPVVVRISGNDYARGVQRVNPDGSLTFRCAMEEGIVLRAAEKDDLLADLERMFEELDHQIADPSAVLLCDCMQRSMEIAQLGLRERVGEIFRRENAIGLSTYGGQYRGIHVNQALSGIAFGR